MMLLAADYMPGVPGAWLSYVYYLPESSQQPWEEGTIIVTILEVRKPRPRGTVGEEVSESDLYGREILHKCKDNYFLKHSGFSFHLLSLPSSTSAP